LSLQLTFHKTGPSGFGDGRRGDLVLTGGPKEIRSEAFSGGTLNHAGTTAAIPNGTYTIRLDIRGIATVHNIVADQDDPSIEVLAPFWGIQQIPESVGGRNARWEWGSIRAALNQTKSETGAAFRGNYLHGKQRPEDYTHGCICERSETILRYLLGLNYRQYGHVTVIVK